MNYTLNPSSIGYTSADGGWIEGNPAYCDINAAVLQFNQSINQMLGTNFKSFDNIHLNKTDKFKIELKFAEGTTLTSSSIGVGIKAGETNEQTSINIDLLNNEYYDTLDFFHTPVEIVNLSATLNSIFQNSPETFTPNTANWFLFIRSNNPVEGEYISSPYITAEQEDNFDIQKYGSRIFVGTETNWQEYDKCFIGKDGVWNDFFKKGN